jgi:ornithine cyclodeaminase/alanine dehydrogenase-like protein (mu-crystallin family)
MVADRMLYLSRADVVLAAGGVDAVGVVRRALVLHANAQTTLPDEAHLGWTTPGGHPARSLALPGALWGGRPALGLKVINSSLGNTASGLPRAQGLTLLFDAETAHPVAILEAAYISMVRTAAYTAATVAALASAPQRIAVIGCGPIGLAHVDVLSPIASDASFVLHDADAGRQEAVVSRLTASPGCAVSVEAADSAETAVRGADVVVTATNTTTGYLPHEWLAPGTLVAHVSLDDVLADVVARADVVLVDDWELVRNDPRRLLGRLYRSGDIRGPDEPAPAHARSDARVIDGTLADVIVGRHPGRRRPDDIILSNPFGIGILDVAVATEVLAVARDAGLGTELPV